MNLKNNMYIVKSGEIKRFKMKLIYPYTKNKAAEEVSIITFMPIKKKDKLNLFIKIKI